MGKRAAPPPARLHRARQGIADFVPGDPQAGYYNDLTIEARRRAAPGAPPAAWPTGVARAQANPITIAQVGLGAWQLAREDEAWLPVVRACAAWVTEQQDERGRLRFLFPMPHTFALEAGWCSAMAQGEAASLLVRAAAACGEERFLAAAARAGAPILDSAEGLVAPTPEGPVLQEYPTRPPAHVLNGWIFALWGLYDLGQSGAAADVRAAAATAFADGARALAARVHLYETAFGWSRYDLFPHRLTHVASPFYHALHVAQLDATARLQPGLPALAATAGRWRAALDRPLARAVGVTRKVAFRVLVPRRSA